MSRVESRESCGSCKQNLKRVHGVVHWYFVRQSSSGNLPQADRHRHDSNILTTMSESDGAFGTGGSRGMSLPFWILEKCNVTVSIRDGAFWLRRESRD